MSKKISDSRLRYAQKIRLVIIMRIADPKILFNNVPILENGFGSFDFTLIAILDTIYYA